MTGRPSETPKPEAARDRSSSAGPTPRRNTDTGRDDERGPDQGIRKDDRGQEQPSDKKRASENR